MTKYTDKQLLALKGIIEYSELFADVIREALDENGLNDIDGCMINVMIDPKLEFVTQSVIFGRENSQAGRVMLAKGKLDKLYTVTGNNTPEYVYLLSEDETKEKMKQILLGMKNPPTDSVWLKGIFNGVSDT